MWYELSNQHMIETQRREHEDFANSTTGMLAKGEKRPKFKLQTKYLWQKSKPK